MKLIKFGKPFAFPASLALAASLLVACNADEAGNKDDANEAMADPETAAKTVDAIEADEDLAAMLPEEYKDEIVFGMRFTFPPMRYEEGGKRYGAEYELGRAVTKKLGAEYKIELVAFDGLVPALKAKRIDVALASWADLPERRNEASFVDYYRSATALMVKKGNPDKIEGIKDLCGRSIALQTGVESVKRAEKQNETCKSDGKEPIDIQLYESSNDATLAVVNGRADSTANDYPAAVNESQTVGNGEALEIVDKPISSDYYYGLGTRTDDAVLQEALRDAVQSLMDSGEYKTIMEAYGVERGMIEKSGINAGPAKGEA